MATAIDILSIIGDSGVLGPGDALAVSGTTKSLRHVSHIATPVLTKLDYVLRNFYKEDNTDGFDVSEFYLVTFPKNADMDISRSLSLTFVRPNYNVDRTDQEAQTQVAHIRIGRARRKTTMDLSLDATVSFSHNEKYHFSPVWWVGCDKADAQTFFALLLALHTEGFVLYGAQPPVITEIMADLKRVVTNRLFDPTLFHHIYQSMVKSTLTHLDDNDRKARLNVTYKGRVVFPIIP